MNERNRYEHCSNCGQVIKERDSRWTYRNYVFTYCSYLCMVVHLVEKGFDLVEFDEMDASGEIQKID